MNVTIGLIISLTSRFISSFAKKSANTFRILLQTHKKYNYIGLRVYRQKIISIYIISK